MKLKKPNKTKRPVFGWISTFPLPKQRCSFDQIIQTKIKEKEQM